MNDQIILELGPKVHNAVVKVEIASLGATPPTRAAVFDKNFVVGKAVVRVVV
jgi:hypothetical protein